MIVFPDPATSFNPFFPVIPFYLLCLEALRLYGTHIMAWGKSVVSDKVNFVLRIYSSSFVDEVTCYTPELSLTLARILFRVRFLLGGRHGEFKFLPPPGYAPCYEAVLPKEKLKVEHSREYKQERTYTRDLLGPTVSLTQAAFTPIPVDTSQVRGAGVMAATGTATLLYCSHVPWFSDAFIRNPQECI